MKKNINKQKKTKTFVKKERNVDKQGWTSPVYKGVWKESQIEWFVEFSHSAGLKVGIHFIHNNWKLILFANENIFLISKKRINESFQIILLEKFLLPTTL